MKNKPINNRIPLLVFLVVLFAGLNLKAQIHEKLQGKLYENITSAEGEALFPDGWFKGVVTLKSNEIFDGVLIRYDKINDKLLYQENGQIYTAGPEVVAFHIPSDVALHDFKKGYPKIGKLTDQAFYEVLHDGTTKLLKKHTSLIKEEKEEDGSAKQRIEDTQQYFVLKDKKMTLLKEPFEQSLLGLLADKRAIMKMVITEQFLEFNEDIDIVTLLEEYDAYKAGSPGH